MLDSAWHSEAVRGRGIEQRAKHSMDLSVTVHQGLIARLDGPLHFRFYGQPAMAVFLAIRDGIRDSCESKPPYLWSILTDKCRGKLVYSGLKSIGKVMIFAAALDLIYQLSEFRAAHMVGLMYAALILAVIPYLLTRGPTNLLRSWILRYINRSSTAKVQLSSENARENKTGAAG